MLGSSGVLIVDVAAAKAAGDFTWSTDGGFKAKGIILHYLEEGDCFNIATRTPLPRPERKPIEKGKEANADYPLETNIFAPDAFRNMLVDGMAENQKNRNVRHRLHPGQGGPRHRQPVDAAQNRQDFAAFYASIKDIDTYTVTYVSLDIQPVSLR